MTIQKMISENESSTLEFKERLPSNEKLAALLCALANSSGGDLVIGIEDGTRNPVGIPEMELLAMEEKIAAIAANNISPMVFPIVKSFRHQNVMLLAVHIDMGYQKPYRVIAGSQSGKVFVRVGSTTRQADAAAEEAMRLRSHGLSWDCLPCLDCDIDVLDAALIDEFIEVRFERRNITKPKKVDAAWLEKMRLAARYHGKMQPTNGAVALFMQSPDEVFPSVAIEMARFAGTAGRDFIDKKTITGPLWKLYNEALSFMRRNVGTAAVRNSGSRRETSSYPEIAFREFMINALCHRSFEKNTGAVRCAIFDDVIQITNPGALPDGLELSDLGAGISVIRNPLIARIFNEIGLIEGWGTGIHVAQQELAQNNLPSARIEQKGFFIQVTSSWRWPVGLSDKETTILRETASRGKITSESVATLHKVTDRAARKMLANLANKDLLFKIGSTKGAVYHLK
jgi:ATP-dependent DNA helicase RecG